MPSPLKSPVPWICKYSGCVDRSISGPAICALAMAHSVVSPVLELRHRMSEVRKPLLVSTQSPAVFEYARWSV